MYKVLITKEIPRISMDILKEHSINFDVLGPNVSLTNLNETFLSNYHGLISMLNQPIGADIIQKMPNLKIVSNYAVGVNNIDLAYLKSKGILIGHTPGVLTEATAELTVALMLATSRNLMSAHKDVLNGSWQDFEPMKYLGPTMFRKKIGIMGFGRIGQKVAEILHYGFQADIHVLRKDGKADQEIKALTALPITLHDEETFFSDLDVLTLHCPLTADTIFWLNEKRIGKLPKKCIVINTGRGELIDQKAIYHALKEKQIWALGTDVTTPEPLPITHELLSLDNVTVIPHIGSASIEARTAMAKITAMNIVMGLKEERVLYSPI